MASRGDVYLIDVNGEVAHQWRMPIRRACTGYLLPNGNMFYGGKVQDETWDRFPSWKRFKGGVMIEVDRHANVVWEHRDPEHHHDHRRTESGGALYMTLELMDPDLAAKVQGGVPDSAPEGMWEDVLVEVDAQGNRTWEWHAAEHLDLERHIVTMNDRRDEWSHGNTIAPIGNDRVMFSFRNISTIGIIDKASGGNYLAAGLRDPGPAARPQHAAQWQRAGVRQRLTPQEFRAAVLKGHRGESANNEIVWEYTDNPAYNFFSSYISGARRLPNGNTLITEGQSGRMFQVTPECEVVWGFINPHFHLDAEEQLVNRVFRATHYLKEDIPWLA